MDNYTHRVKDIKEIRKTLDRSEVLSILEMKEYQKITEKLLGLQTALGQTSILRLCRCQRRIRRLLSLILEI